MAEKSADVVPEAAGSQDEKPSGNWWDSWITTAKSKSAEVYTMVKKDLDEIGSAVKSEASHVFSSTSTVIGKTLKLENPESTANVMKKSFSTFIGQVNTVLNPEPDDEDDTEVILSSGDTTMLSTYKKELEALQRVDATFLVPANSPEFDAWLGSLEAGGAGVATASAAARRLAADAGLRAQYERLVPDAVTQQDFWERYLFRVALLQDRLAAAARKAPEEPVTNDPVLAHLPLHSQPAPIQQSPKKVLSGIEDAPELAEVASAESVVAWEDELSDVQPDINSTEDFANDVELTEEQQTLLLEEYEKEITNKKQKATKDVTNNNSKQTTTNTPKSKTKAAQTRDKMNNKQTTTNKGKNKNGGLKSPKKPAKDVCGNDLVEDHFAERDDNNDDANSDESWEKEFEIDDVKVKA